MTPISEIKEAVVTALQAVPSIGNVYPRRRFAATDSALYSIYKNAQTGDLRAFEVSQYSRSSIISAGAAFSDVTIGIDAIMSFNDDNDSQSSFDNLLESAHVALNGLFTIGALSKKCALQSISYQYSGEQNKAGVLCHVAKFIFSIKVYR
jgi:hypothetical protein